MKATTCDNVTSIYDAEAKSAIKTDLLSNSDESNTVYQRIIHEELDSAISSPASCGISRFSQVTTTDY